MSYRITRVWILLLFPFISYSQDQIPQPVVTEMVQAEQVTTLPDTLADESLNTDGSALTLDSLYADDSFRKLDPSNVEVLPLEDDASQKVGRPSKKRASEAQKADAKKPAKLRSLGFKVLPDTTFRAYSSATSPPDNIAVWKTTSEEKQKPYNVSLVAVNLNTWLENPEYFSTLLEMAKAFPVNNLLDNLQANNPQLKFNDPEVVRQALATDIYTPYLRSISNFKPIRQQFSKIKSRISFTKRYHIYGASVGDLPYFGRPLEGAERKINLGLVPYQLEETIAKLPDTDIFLVAMINVVPNFLEETYAIYQVNQQVTEILVYAFDRRGKLIGGAGVPQKFFYNGSEFKFTQQVTSKVWQPSLSREFYLFPSLKIENTPLTKGVNKPAIAALPFEGNISLTGQQKSIVNALIQLRGEGRSENIQLFDEKGKFLLSRNKISKPKVELVSKKLVHKQSEVVADGFARQDIFVRLADQSTAPAPRRTQKNQRRNRRKKGDPRNIKEFILDSKLPPSNEGVKLESVITDTWKILTEKVYTNNLISHTNKLLPFETENEPLVYRQKYKTYYTMDLALKELKKEYDQQTKEIIAENRRIVDERIFWQTHFVKYSEKGQAEFNEWKKNINTYQKLLDKMQTYSRETNFLVEHKKDIEDISVRITAITKEKYSKNEEKLAKELAKHETNVTKLLAKYQSRSDKSLSNITSLKEKTGNARGLARSSYKTYMENVGQVKNFEVKETPYDVEEIARNNGISENFVKFILGEGDISPRLKYQDALAKKQARADWINQRILYYDGYMLGLTDAWSVKTMVQDRLQHI